VIDTLGRRPAPTEIGGNQIFVVSAGPRKLLDERRAKKGGSPDGPAAKGPSEIYAQKAAGPSRSAKPLGISEEGQAAAAGVSRQRWPAPMAITAPVAPGERDAVG